MPTTRKQKKSRKSREVDMLSDSENLDVVWKRMRVKLVIMTEGLEVPVLAHDRIRVVILIPILMKRKVGLTPKMAKTQKI